MSDSQKQIPKVIESEGSNLQQTPPRIIKNKQYGNKKTDKKKIVEQYQGKVKIKNTQQKKKISQKRQNTDKAADRQENDNAEDKIEDEESTINEYASMSFNEGKKPNKNKGKSEREEAKNTKVNKMRKQKKKKQTLEIQIEEEEILQEKQNSQYIPGSESERQYLQQMKILRKKRKQKQKKQQKEKQVQIKTPKNEKQKQNSNMIKEKKEKKEKKEEGRQINTEKNNPQRQTQQKQVNKEEEEEKFEEQQIVYVESSSPFCKIFLSLIWMFICIFAFPPSKISQTYLISVQDGQIQPVLNIQTDKFNRKIQISVSDTYHISDYIPISSTKVGKFQIDIEYSLGYRIQGYQEDDKGDYFIRMSSLDILGFTINDITPLVLSDGYFNGWNFEDYQAVKAKIQQEYLPSFKKNVLSTVSAKRLKRYEDKSKVALQTLVSNNQPILDWFLSRLDIFVDGALKPYISDHYAEYTNHITGKKQKALLDKSIIGENITID